MEETLEMLPDDLKNEVLNAGVKNGKISERALKGIDKSFKNGEKNADDGKLIPNKGKYYDSDTKPSP